MSSAAVHVESDASLSRTDTPSDSEELDISGLVVILSFCLNIIFLKLGILSSKLSNAVSIDQNNLE